MWICKISVGGKKHLNQIKFIVLMKLFLVTYFIKELGEWAPLTSELYDQRDAVSYILTLSSFFYTARHD